MQIYLCEKVSLVNEMYFAIMLDRTTAGPVSFTLIKYINLSIASNFQGAYDKQQFIAHLLEVYRFHE